MTAAIPMLLAAGLMAGFGRVDLEPPAGHSLAGYFSPRPCEGVLDPVEANCVALSDGACSALLYSLDLVEVKGLCDRWRREIAAATGVAPEAVYIACTHSHTAPSVGRAADSYEISVEGPAAYDDAVLGKLVEAGRAALSDLAPATMRLGRAKPQGQLGNLNTLFVDVNTIEVVFQDAILNTLELNGRACNLGLHLVYQLVLLNKELQSCIQESTTATSGVKNGDLQQPLTIMCELLQQAFLGLQLAALVGEILFLHNAQCLLFLLA